MSDTVLSWISGRMAVVKKLVGVPLERLSVDSINGGMNAIDEIKRNIQPNMLHNYLPDFVNKGLVRMFYGRQLSQFSLVPVKN